MPYKKYLRAALLELLLSSLLSASHSVYICIPIYLNLFKGPAQASSVRLDCQQRVASSGADAALTMEMFVPVSALSSQGSGWYSGLSSWRIGGCSEALNRLTNFSAS